jgi:2-polyprenyl-3-methyl-5-hydroxy-6-metoxy-1,4-benzoquinol methylase
MSGKFNGYGKTFPKRANIGERNSYLKEKVLGTRVAHLGCTDWPLLDLQIENNNLLHSELLKQCSEVMGIDIDSEGISHMQSSFPGEIFIQGDISTSSKARDAVVGFEPDWILVPDVIEHVENGRDFLISLREILTKSNCGAIITTPNSTSLKTFLPLILGLDFTHVDHCLLHNEFTLVHALEDAGLFVVDLSYFNRDITKRYGGFLQLISSSLNLFCKVNPRFSDGLVVTVRAL